LVSVCQSDLLERISLIATFIDSNPHNGVLAAVTQLGEVLEIYNLKDSIHTVRIGPHGEPMMVFNFLR